MVVSRLSYSPRGRTHVDVRQAQAQAPGSGSAAAVSSATAIRGPGSSPVARARLLSLHLPPAVWGLLDQFLRRHAPQPLFGGRQACADSLARSRAEARMLAHRREQLPLGAGRASGCQGRAAGLTACRGLAAAWAQGGEDRGHWSQPPARATGRAARGCCRAASG